MNLTLAVDVGDADRVLLVPRHENDFSSVGTVAEVSDLVRLPGGGRAVTLRCLYRAVIGAAQSGPDGRLRVDAEPRPDDTPGAAPTRELERAHHAALAGILELRGV